MVTDCLTGEFSQDLLDSHPPGVGVAVCTVGCDDVVGGIDGCFYAHSAGLLWEEVDTTMVEFGFNRLWCSNKKPFPSH